jgi:hypothetical protein
MKISHAEIETCRRSPRAWIRERIRPGGGGPRTGYDGATKKAIYNFHKKLDPAEARLYLERAFGSYRLTSTSRMAQALAALTSYMRWYKRTSPVVVGSKLLLDYDLGSGWRLGGEISRADLDPRTGKYGCVILGKAPPNWRQQIRIPLIQRALADKLERPEIDISVGYQNLDGTSIELVSFSLKKLDEAEATARELMRDVAEEWRRQGGR